MDLEWGLLLGVVAPFQSIQVDLIQSQTDNQHISVFKRERRERD